MQYEVGGGIGKHKNKVLLRYLRSSVLNGFCIGLSPAARRSLNSDGIYEMARWLLGSLSMHLGMVESRGSLQ